MTLEQRYEPKWNINVQRQVLKQCNLKSEDYTMYASELKHNASFCDLGTYFHLAFKTLFINYINSDSNWEKSEDFPYATESLIIIQK
jgi:hypothetical protein